MASRTTSFATGPMMLVFRKVEEIMRADPVLAQGVKTWSTWNGSANDAMPVTPSMCPYIRLSPISLPPVQQSVSHVAAALGIRIESAVAGLIAEDIVNFWDAIQDSLHIDKPFQGSTAYCTLQGVKAFSHEFTRPGFDAWRNEQNPPTAMLQGTGLLVLRVTRTA